MLVLLRDGRKLIGVLRSYDQFGTIHTHTLSLSHYTPTLPAIHQPSLSKLASFRKDEAQRIHAPSSKLTLLPNLLPFSFSSSCYSQPCSLGILRTSASPSNLHVCGYPEGCVLGQGRERRSDGRDCEFSFVSFPFLSSTSTRLVRENLARSKVELRCYGSGWLASAASGRQVGSSELS